MREVVEVVSYETQRVVHTLGPFPSERIAEKAQAGVDANLDHENYYTRLATASAERSAGGDA